MTTPQPPAAQGSEHSLAHYREYLLVLARAGLAAHLRSKVDPSDIVQETLLAAQRELHRFRGSTPGELAAWLRQILARLLVDAQRAYGRAKRDVRREQSLEDVLDHTSLRLGGLLAADQSSPSQQAERHERAVKLAALLAQLPASQREALWKRHVEGWSLEQIAVHMQCTPAAAAGLIKRGLRRLRSLLPQQE